MQNKVSSPKKSVYNGLWIYDHIKEALMKLILTIRMFGVTLTTLFTFILFLKLCYVYVKGVLAVRTDEYQHEEEYIAM
jgi:hypothetical protein